MHPVQAIEEAVGFVEKHSMRGAVIGRVRRRDRWSLPPEAVREAIGLSTRRTALGSWARKRAYQEMLRRKTEGERG